MARVEIPIGHRFLLRSGDKVLRAELDLELKTNANSWEPATFVFDSGTEMTTMQADRARSLDLPMPRRPVRGLFLHGQEVRAGLLRVRVVGLDPTEYHIPCRIEAVREAAVLATERDVRVKSLSPRIESIALRRDHPKWDVSELDLGDRNRERDRSRTASQP